MVEPLSSLSYTYHAYFSKCGGTQHLIITFSVRFRSIPAILLTETLPKQRTFG
jgi:hypothetical protein